MKSRALLVRGHQGVGKTALAEHLSNNYGFCRVSKDEFYDPIIAATGDHKTSSHLAYIAMQAVLLSNANTGINFVVDAPFNGPLGSNELSSRLESVGMLTRNVLLICTDLETWKHRLSNREEDTSPSHQLTSLEEIIHFRGTLETHPLPNELILDTSSTPITALASVSADYLLANRGDK